MSGGTPNIRYKKTLAFLESRIGKDQRILDLGTENPFTKIMKDTGYQVQNTKGEDLDNEFKVVNDYEVDCYTSFEIFEHLLAPYNILKEIKKGKLVVTVPLKVWFAKAYWNQKEEWDRHYHEFEPRQFDWLLEKTGWKIIHKESWSTPDKLRPGIRPILRYFTPSYYLVYAEKGLDNK